MATTDDFADALADALGIRKGGWFRNFIATWAHFEGGHAANNPLNTSRDYPGSTFYNDLNNEDGGYAVRPGVTTAGVRNYPSFDAGVQATAATLKQSNFAPILDFITRQDFTRDSKPNGWDNFIANLRHWGTTGFADSLSSSWQFYADVFRGGSAKPIDVWDFVPDPRQIPGAVGGAINTVEDAARAAGKLAQWAMNPQNWFRVFFVLAGGTLVILGAWIYFSATDVGSKMQATTIGAVKGAV